MTYTYPTGSMTILPTEEKKTWFYRVYDRETEIFERFLSPGPGEQAVYRSAPSFAVTERLEPPLSGGLWGSILELSDIVITSKKEQARRRESVNRLKKVVFPSLNDSSGVII